MSSKTYKRYPAKDALKKGSASTIESACTKTTISSAFVEVRQKYNTLKNEYEKSQVKLEQMDQLKKDNDSKLIQLTKKNDTIKKLHITITQLNNDIKLLKDTSVDRGDAGRLEGFIKKKDNEIEYLKNQINETKINNLDHLKNTIHQQNEQIKYLKEGYGKFNVEDESLKEENKLLKEGLERLKEENEALIKKLDEYKKISTMLFDLG
tara:strand:+ start:7963 stop:8586 length:624 start_codon:yes stop_codon:yes gene_type:complete